MKILFDQGTPRPLRNHLSGHDVTIPRELGWSSITNGELLTRAENAGFDLLITTDGNMSSQLDISRWRIAILVIRPTNWSVIRTGIPSVLEAIERSSERGYQVLIIEPQSDCRLPPPTSTCSLSVRRAMHLS